MGSHLLPPIGGHSHSLALALLFSEFAGIDIKVSGFRVLGFEGGVGAYRVGIGAVLVLAELPDEV